MLGTRRALGLVYYGGLLLILAGILGELFSALLPGSIAGRLGHNSEAFLLALAVPAWLQFVRPRFTDAGISLLGVIVTGVSCASAGLLLLASDLPSRFRTLNETFLALAVLIPYLAIRRPLPPWLAPAISVLLLTTIVAFSRTQVGIDLAETLGVLVLAPLAFDVVDRAIVDPNGRTSVPLRYTWYVVLVVLPLLLSVLEYRIGVRGSVDEVVRYGVRVTEAFLGLLLIEGYLAVALRQTGPDNSHNFGNLAVSGHSPNSAIPGDQSVSPSHWQR